MSAWILLAAPLALGLLIVILLALGTAIAPARASRMLGIIGAGAIAVAVIGAAVAILAALTALLSDPVVVSFPVETLPIVPPDGVTFDSGPDATVLSGGMDHATAEVRGLSAPTRVLLASGTLLSSAMVVVIALAVARLARSLRQGDAFRPGAARAFTVSAFAVFLGGGVSSIVTQLGEWRVSEEVLRVSSWGYTGPASPTTLSDLGWPDPAPFFLTLEWWPLLVAFALAAIGLAFRAGERLTERVDTAEHELRGLV